MLSIDNRAVTPSVKCESPRKKRIQTRVRKLAQGLKKKNSAEKREPASARGKYFSVKSLASPKALRQNKYGPALTTCTERKKRLTVAL